MRTVWKILRRLLIGAVALIVLLMIWFIASSFYDETLDPNFNQFFHADTPVPDDQNGFLPLNGIDAPSEAQMAEYGRTISERYKQKPENYTYIVNKPVGDSLNCWTSLKSSTDKPENNTCLTAEELSKVLAKNGAFLKNYRSLYRYPRFQRASMNASLDGNFYGADLIRLHELSIAQLVLAANQGNVENALGLWIADTQFVQRLMHDKAGMVDKSIFLVLYNINIKAFPLIASRLTPEQLVRYRPQLSAIFDTPAFGANGWDVAATMRWEKEFLLSSLEEMARVESEKRQIKGYSLAFYKPQATRNSFYEFAHDLVELSQAAPSEMAQKFSVMKEKYRRKALVNSTLTLFLYNIIGKLALDGVYVTQDLLLSPAANFSHRQLLKLYTEACIAHIAADQMKQFVATSPIKNPITNQSFEYDDAKQTLTVIDNLEMRFEVPYNEMPINLTHPNK